MQAIKKSTGFQVLVAFCFVPLAGAINSAEYFFTKGDITARLNSGEVYVSSRQKGRLGCTLSRLPLIKKDQAEAVEEALMHKVATINHEEHKENPLFDDAILFFDMFDSGRGLMPLFVGEHAPAMVYLMQRYEPCTLQGEVMVKEKKEEAKPVVSTEKKSSAKKSARDKKPEDKKVEEKKKEPAPCELLSSGVLKDAAGNDAGEILAIEQINPTMIAVALAPKGGNFGTPGSGIALVQIVEEVEKQHKVQTVSEQKNTEEKKTKPSLVRVFKQISARGLVDKDDICAYPLDGASLVITLGEASVASLGNSVSLHWDKRLERLFIGLEVTPTNDQQACAATVVARIEYDEEEQSIVDTNKEQKKPQEKVQELAIKRIYHPKLHFEPIFSKVILEDQSDYIVAQKGGGQTIVVDEIKTLWTGTQTPHLIVLRRDLHAQSRAAIFAIPLVSGKAFELAKRHKKIKTSLAKEQKIAAKEGTSEYKKQAARNEVVKKALEDEARSVYCAMKEADISRGTLASVKQGVEELFFDTHPYNLEERRLPLEGAQAEDLFTVQSQAACVGGRALKGYIGDITVRGDAVEVTVYTLDNTKEVYFSRPILNSVGMIDRWTVWRPLATVKNIFLTTDDQMQRPYFDGQHDTCAVSIEQKDGVTLHKRIKNNDVSEEPLHLFATQVNELCKDQSILGARELVIGNPCAEHEILACAYTTKQLVLSTLDRYQGSETHSFSFPYEMKSLRGVAVTAEYSKILFVGGHSGLYALVDAQGNGWPLDKNFKDLSDEERAALSFVRVGESRRIRSLVCDEHFLYVLTNKTFERIDLTASSFTQDSEIVTTTLAVCDALPEHGAMDIFLDVVVSDKLALIATTRGFFRSGDNLDVRLLSDTALGNWIRINVPCQEGPIVQLVPLSVTGVPTDCARCGGGELYVLNAYAGYNSTRVTRYHIADCSCMSVCADTVQLLPDRFMKDEETTFIRLNDYTTSLAIDGGSCLLVHPGSDTQPSHFYQKEFPAEKAHVGASRFMRKAIAFELAEHESIIATALSSATGKMLVTTTQGLRILD